MSQRDISPVLRRPICEYRLSQRIGGGWFARAYHWDPESPGVVREVATGEGDLPHDALDAVQAALNAS